MRSERNASQLDNPNNPELVPQAWPTLNELSQPERDKVALLLQAAKQGERRIRELLGQVHSDPFDAVWAEVHDPDMQALQAAIRQFDEG